MSVQHYDAIVIGAGQGGGPLASALAEAGRKTAIVEREHVGGTCINEGCTPTKTMIASARVAYLARRAADYGVHTGDVRVDLARVRERKRDIVNSFRSGSESRLRATKGLDLLEGEASFSGPHTIDVRLAGGNSQLEAELIVINTGARPALPPVDGLDAVHVLNSTTIMELDQVPEHLLVLGGGYVGLEFGQMFRRFGASVTIVQRGPKLLAREDDDVADEVASILRQDGIQVLLQAEARRAWTRRDGKIALEIGINDEQRELSGTHILAAAGRAPNTEALKLPLAGIETETRGHIVVDEQFRTNVPGVYAIGDVTGGPAFTHISYDDYRILKTNLIDGGSASSAGRLVPYTVFIDPQLGRVGMTEREARDAGRKIKVASMPMSSVARALEVDETRGLMKAVVDADSGQILGVAVLGIEGGETMSLLEVAMMGKLPYTALRDAIFAHPTLAEALNNLFASLE